MNISLFTLIGYLTLIILFILLYFWRSYNSFIKKRNQVKTDFSDIEVQLRKRVTLIERLANLIREYAKHEKQTFEKVSQARSAIDTSKTIKDVAKAENLLAQTLRSLFAVVEDYPKLKASENYKIVQADLKETEDLIANYREEYNRAVQKYNNSIQTFPNLLAARLFKFKEEDLFRATV